MLKSTMSLQSLYQDTSPHESSPSSPNTSVKSLHKSGRESLPASKESLRMSNIFYDAQTNKLPDLRLLLESEPNARLSWAAGPPSASLKSGGSSMSSLSEIFIMYQGTGSVGDLSMGESSLKSNRNSIKVKKSLWKSVFGADNTTQVKKGTKLTDSEVPSSE